MLRPIVRFTDDEIMAIAAQTRQDFDTKSLKVQDLQTLIVKYFPYIAENYKADLPDWIEQTLSSFPVTACELATAVLIDRFRAGEIVYGRYEHEPITDQNIRKTHTFWMRSEHEAGSSLIADITADQYGGPPTM